MQPAAGVLVEHVLVALEIRDQLRTERAPLLRAADGIHLQLHALDAQLPPQPPRHHQQLDIDVGVRVPERFRPERMVLAVASLLGPLVPEQRAAVPQPLRPLVEQVVLQRRAHGWRRAFRAQGELLAVHRVDEGVHLLLDDVGRLAYPAHEELRPLDDGRADLAVAVLLEHRARGFLEKAPAVRLVRQDIVHPADRLYPFGRHQVIGLRLRPGFGLRAGYLAATYCSTICWNSAAMFSPFSVTVFTPST